MKSIQLKLSIIAVSESIRLGSKSIFGRVELLGKDECGGGVGGGGRVVGYKLRKCCM